MAMKTRAGLVPVETEIPFNVTTKKAEEFLQKKFDAIVSLMRKNGKEQNDINVVLITTKCSKKFHPFMVILPTDVLSSKKEKKNEYELDLFNPSETERTAKLTQEFFQLISAYSFNKNDEKAFFSNSWRNSLGVSLKTSHFLKNNRVPKIQSFNKGKDQYVVCMIDPIRLFHDMLSNPDDKNERFVVEIDKTQEIGTGNYAYDVYRVAKKGKKKNDDSLETRIMHEVNALLRN